MEEDSLPRRGPEAKRVDSNFPHYIRPRRTYVKERALPKKAVTTLVAPRIPIDAPLLKDILPELARLKFQEFDTRQQEGLQRTDCMVADQFTTSDAQVLRPMEWAEGLAHTGLTNMLFMPHFIHIIQVNTYVN